MGNGAQTYRLDYNGNHYANSDRLRLGLYTNTLNQHDNANSEAT